MALLDKLKQKSKSVVGDVKEKRQERKRTKQQQQARRERARRAARKKARQKADAKFQEQLEERLIEEELDALERSRGGGLLGSAKGTLDNVEVEPLAGGGDRESDVQPPDFMGSSKKPSKKKKDDDFRFI